MKPAIKKLKDIRGRRIMGYKAVGPGTFMSANGATPKEAADRWEEAIVSALARLDRGTLISQWRGHVYVIAPTASGWSYWIDTFSRDGYSVHVPGPAREDAQDAAVHHLAQQVWDPSVTDDAAFVEGLPSSVAAEITRWIRFQRSYAALRAEGKSDTEAHRLACST